MWWVALHLRPFSLSDGEQADPLSKRAGGKCWIWGSTSGESFDSRCFSKSRQDGVESPTREQTVVD